MKKKDELSKEEKRIAAKLFDLYKEHKIPVRDIQEVGLSQSGKKVYFYSRFLKEYGLKAKELTHNIITQVASQIRDYESDLTDKHIRNTRVWNDRALQDPKWPTWEVVGNSEFDPSMRSPNLHAVFKQRLGVKEPAPIPKTVTKSDIITKSLSELEGGSPLKPKSKLQVYAMLTEAFPDTDEDYILQVLESVLKNKFKAKRPEVQRNNKGFWVE